MRSLTLAALLGVALLLNACGGRPVAASGHPHPTPYRAPRGHPAPARLAWRAGETFAGAVTFDERDQGDGDDELRFTAHEGFQVLRVRAGVATIRVAVTSWRWQRNTSALLTTALPAPAAFEVDAAGESLSGVDWPLPSELPLPGLDVFAAPLTSGTGWSRTDGEGVALSYQQNAGRPRGTTSLAWSVVRPQFTTSGDPITVSGSAEATVSSRYRRRGTTVTLASTREWATFERTTQSAAGTTRQTGTIIETTVYSPF